MQVCCKPVVQQVVIALWDLQQVLNYLAGGREVGNLVSIACQSVLARPAAAQSKRLAYDIAKTAALSSDDWDAACDGLRADVAGSHTPEVSTLLPRSSPQISFSVHPQVQHRALRQFILH